MGLKKEIKCPKCNHEWETSSKLKQITCPSCLLKVPNQYFKENQKGGDTNGFSEKE